MIKTKKETIKSLATHEKDVGSTEIQIGLLTDRITKLSEHFKLTEDKTYESNYRLANLCAFIWLWPSYIGY